MMGRTLPWRFRCVFCGTRRRWWRENHSCPHSRYGQPVDHIWERGLAMVTDRPLRLVPPVVSAAHAVRWDVDRFLAETVPPGMPNPQPVVLVDRAGNAVKEYGCDRQFGTIEHDGRRFLGRRLKAGTQPPFVYVEEQPKAKPHQVLGGVLGGRLL